MPRRSRTLTGAMALVLLLAAAATPALAKMGAEAKLDTPISRDAAPGSTIEVGWSVFSDVDGSQYPLYGSPVFIRLLSPDRRSVNEVLGTETPSGSGHYTAKIQVPAGGIGEVIVGLFGESCVAGEGCQRSDILFPLTDDPLVSGATPAVGTGTTASTGPALLPLVMIGTAIAVVAAWVAAILGRRRTLGTDAAGR